MNPLFDRIVEWVRADPRIKALILLGSLAAGKGDEFSDFDLEIFSDAFDIQDEKWLSKLNEVWVCVHEKVERSGKMFPTRLVIFDKGVKADFAFYTLDVLKKLSAKPLPNEYNRGYTVLVDKDSLTTGIPQASHQEDPAQKPSQEAFTRIVNEFWFEVHYMAKYLKRRDLWSVKFRSQIIHDFLLKMIEWNEEARLNWSAQVPPSGKRMKSWVDPETWQALHHVFAHFDADDSQKALASTIELFRRLAVDAASRLGYPYPHTLDRNMSNFVTRVLA